MHIKRIATLNTYEDLLKKSEYELEKYKKSALVYDMANCFLSLNALPEWICKSDSASVELKQLANLKKSIMTDESYSKNIEKLKDYNIDYLLRFIRTFSNHSKHFGPKQNLVRISISASLPAKFPIRFTNIIIGDDENNSICSIRLLNDVIDFWKKHIDL